MSAVEPISDEEMTGHLRRAVNRNFGLEIAEPPQGASFELVAPSTGQRFRVTVAEVESWSGQMEAELAAEAGS
jgi:hypothetical protein